MRFAVTALGLLTGLALAAPALAKQAPPLELKTITYQGWKGCQALVAGPYRVVVAPGIGGRIVDYSKNGEGPIWTNEAERGEVHPLDPKVWWNYGGYKTWPAPQSKWGWPPDPLLDAAPATVKPWNKNGKLYGLRIIGQSSPQSGIAFDKYIRLEPGTGKLFLWQGMRALLSNRESVEWGVWDITQVDASGWVAVPLNPDSRHEGGVYFYSPDAKASKQWKVRDGLLLIKNEGEVGKWGADTSAGWMVWLKDDLAYVKRYPKMTPGLTYPDEFSTAQIYTNNTELPYTEMEVAGPVLRLNPGEKTALDEIWHLVSLPEPVKDEEDVLKAVAYLKRNGYLNPVTQGLEVDE